MKIQNRTALKTLSSVSRVQPDTQLLPQNSVANRIYAVLQKEAQQKKTILRHCLKFLKSQKLKIVGPSDDTSNINYILICTDAKTFWIWRCKNGMHYLYHHATFGRSDVTPHRGRVK